jgi:hypothetical protein
MATYVDQIQSHHFISRKHHTLFFGQLGRIWCMARSYHRLIKCVIGIWLFLVKVKKFIYFLKYLDRIALTSSVFRLQVKVRCWVNRWLVVSRLVFLGSTSRLPCCRLILLLRVDSMFIFHVRVHSWITQVGSFANLALVVSSVFFVP